MFKYSGFFSGPCLSVFSKYRSSNSVCNHFSSSDIAATTILAKSNHFPASSTCSEGTMEAPEQYVEYVQS